MGRSAARRLRRRAGVALVALAVVSSSCATKASEHDAQSPSPLTGRSARVLRVPSQYRTIQRAVTAAAPGDLVLISPGTYHEAVRVTTSRLVIRGLDRNAVILDGRDQLINGFEVSGDRVAVENLTVRRYAVNGVIFTSGYGTDGGGRGPRGWRASYVTAENNGLYGLYAFDARGGTFDHDLATGSPDSGIYVGQCKPCDAVVVDNIAEHNAIGYEATNATGVDVVGNIWRNNRIGMTTGSGRQETLAPQSGSRIVANVVDANDDADTPATPGGFGVGIVIAGGRGNVVERNVVERNPAAGIVITDQDGYDPRQNGVRSNALSGNGVDLAIGATGVGSFPPAGNCWAANLDQLGAVSSDPPGVQTLLPCDAPARVSSLGPASFPAGPPGVDYGRVARSAPQPSMPGAALKWTAPPFRPPAPNLSQAAPPGSA